MKYTDKSVVWHDTQNPGSLRELQTKLHYVVRETVSNFRSLEGVGDSRRKDDDVTNLISNYMHRVYAVLSTVNYLRGER